MTDFTDVFHYLIEKCRNRLSADLLLVMSFCIIASYSIAFTYSGNRLEPGGLWVAAEPVYLSQGASVDITNVIQSDAAEDTDDIQYIVRNEDGSPSATMRVVKGQLQADAPGTGYLYIYINGEASQNGIPVHVYETEAEKQEAVLVHQQLKQNEVSENDPVPAAYPAAEESSGTPAEVSAVPEAGQSVVFAPAPSAAGLSQIYVPDYYRSTSLHEGREYIALVVNGVRTGIPVLLLFCERTDITAWPDQKADLLPWIWKIPQDGERILISADAFTWETSDPAVIAVEDGVPVIAGEGEAELTGKFEGTTIRIHVTVADPGEITDFNTEVDEPFTLDFSEDSVSYSSPRTFCWPTELPAKKDKTVKIKGGRIYQCGSQYYYLEDDIDTEWDEAFLNDPEHIDEMIRISQGLTLMEGDNLSGIIPGVVFRHHDQFWLYTGCEEPAEPYENDDGWIEISDIFEEQDDYDPGADTGPESDAFAYPDSQYNPYPGSISSNCTYAVWALANEALGVRLPNWGDAGNWYRRAGISGYPTGQNPAPYSIIVWDHHVGFVTAVSEDGTMIYIKEGNFSGRYHEGWWAAAPSRHGQKLYGYIYLTDNHGDAISPKTVEVTEGFSDTEEVFLKLLEELGLEPGERKEVYSDDVEEGYIVSYTTGELPVGSVIDYSVSIGPEPEIVIDSDVSAKLAGMTREKLFDWLEEHGLEPGEETVEESDQEDGIVLRVTKGHYKEGDEVSYTVSKKKTAPVTDPSQEPDPAEVTEPVEDPADPQDPVNPVDNPEVIPGADPVPDPIPDPDPIQEPIYPDPQDPQPEVPVNPDQPEPPAEPLEPEEPEQPQPEPEPEPDPDTPAGEPPASADPSANE